VVKRMDIGFTYLISLLHDFLSVPQGWPYDQWWLICVKMFGAVREVAGVVL